MFLSIINIMIQLIILAIFIILSFFLYYGLNNFNNYITDISNTKNNTKMKIKLNNTK